EPCTGAVATCDCPQPVSAAATTRKAKIAERLDRRMDIKVSMAMLCLNVIGWRLELARHGAVEAIAEVFVCAEVDVFTDEVDRPVRETELHAARMPTERAVVAGHPILFRRSQWERARARDVAV